MHNKTIIYLRAVKNPLTLTVAIFEYAVVLCKMNEMSKNSATLQALCLLGIVFLRVVKLHFYFACCLEVMAGCTLIQIRLNIEFRINWWWKLRRQGCG